MNIHFTSKELKEQLDQSTIFEIEVGSGMYGLKTPESDIDILKIYLEGSLNLTSITNNHHQLQYNDTENNIDYIYTSVGQFVKNIISGDSTINYEVLQSSEFRKQFKDLYSLANKLDKINTIKSYLGMAKRDIKMLKYDFNNKKLYHFVRGVEFASAILNDQNIFNILEENRLNMENCRNDSSLNKDSFIVGFYETKMNTLRESIKDKQFKPKSFDIMNINVAIFKIYYLYRDKQLDYIDYDSLIEDAVYEDKFNY